MALKVSVAILNWNGKRHLERFLLGIVENSPEAQVIVVDNASTDGSIEWIGRNFPDMRVIQNGQNLGYAGGYAKSIPQIEADIIVLLNSDVEVSSGWLVPILRCFEAEPNLGALQPKILDLNAPDKFEYAGACGGYIDKFGIPFCRGRIFESLENDHGQYDNPLDVFWATGACLAVRKLTYEDAGTLDPDLFAHMEEIDLCWRMWRNGWRVSVEPTSKVWHLGGGTLGKESPFKTYLNFRNGLLILIRNLPISQLTWVLPMRITFDALAAWRGLFGGNWRYFLAILKAHVHAMIRIPKFWAKRGGNYPKNLPGIFNGSVIMCYFLGNKKTFKQIWN